ncbi:MAG: class II aldolase/adducin family protein [Rhodospirillaceae bacterium]
MQALFKVLRDLVAANRILAHEGVVDAYGHVSVRHPDRPDRFFLSRSRSPELVTLEDLLEFDLGGEPVEADGPAPYAERFIHAAIYEARRDVNSVVHNHAHELIPFGVTKAPLRPIFHTASRIGAEVPVWDIRDKFGDTNLLVVNIAQGRDLAKALADKKLVLMRGHGCAVGATDIYGAVATSIYAQVNARLQMQAMALGEVAYLSPGEIAAMNDNEYAATKGQQRAWEYLKHRAGCE